MKKEKFGLFKKRKEKIFKINPKVLKHRRRNDKGK